MFIRVWLVNKSQSDPISADGAKATSSIAMTWFEVSDHAWESLKYPVPGSAIDVFVLYL